MTILPDTVITNALAIKTQNLGTKFATKTISYILALSIVQSSLKAAKLVGTDLR